MWSLQFPLYQNLTQFNGSRFSRRFCGVWIFSWRLLIHLLCWLSNPALYMDSVLGGVSIAMINTRTAATWEGKGLFHCTPLRSQSVIQEVMAECCWLASPHGFLSFSYTTLDHLHRGGTTHNGRGPPTSIIYQGNSWEVSCEPYAVTSSQFRVLFPNDSSLCQVTQSSQHTRPAFYHQLSTGGY